MTSNQSRTLVGCSVLALAIGIVIGLFLWPVPAANADLAMVILGIVIGWAGNVVQFHFGTSEGSKTKTEMLGGRGGDAG